jgi:uroporphyrinogen decarboxylase
MTSASDTHTTRERLRRTLRFDRPDRLLLWDLEGFAEGAIRRWCGEGFPLGMTPYDYFGFDRGERVPLDTDPIPSFVPRTLDEGAEWRTRVDTYGFTVKELKTQTVTPSAYYYVDAPIKSRADWELMKRRYDPQEPRRYPKAWSPELMGYYRDAEHPIWLFLQWGPGRGIKNGYMIGTERFLEVLSDDPDLISDIFAFWADFCIELLRPVLRETKIDYVFVNEDGMGYKNGPLVSPAMYEKLWMPGVKRVTDVLRDNGVEFVGYYSSGNLNPLIPSLLKAGFNLLGPLECAAAMDAVALRKQYGRDLLLMGNIARAAFMKGPDAVEEEFESKVPWLVEQGGYVAALDDMVLPDMSLASFQRYVELVKGFRAR